MVVRVIDLLDQQAELVDQVVAELQVLEQVEQVILLQQLPLKVNLVVLELHFLTKVVAEVEQVQPVELVVEVLQVGPQDQVEQV
ncbi:MAG: hypothetical protein CMJ17_14295 [Phenylobacterium sp.]|nr:hypothetical protein [Phenylobacterium sp.]